MRRSVIVVPALLLLITLPLLAGIDIDESREIDGTINTNDFVPKDLSSLMGFDDFYDLGYDGTDVTVAILDTGINGFHLDLRHGVGTSQSLITVNQSFVPLKSPVDEDGHGTFIAGMLIGNGDASTGSIVGMINASEIWNLRVLDENGEGEESWMVNALDWILVQTEKPDIVSLSLGSLVPLPSVETRVKQLWDQGIIVVTASGNEGPDYYTVNSPGTVLEVITVGSSTDDDYLLSFSSEGPTMDNYFYKPEVVTYGLDLTSLDLNIGYVTGSGTSFSVPFIVAGIALIEDATDDAYSPDEIKAAVMESATPLGYSYFMDGAGLPNFSKALELLENPSWDGVSVLPGNVEFPIQNKDGTPNDSELEKYILKATVVNSRYDGDLTIELDGDFKDFSIIGFEEYDGGRDQFVITIRVVPTSSSFGSDSGEILLKKEDDSVLATIGITITTEPSIWMTIIIIGSVVGFLVGVIAMFAVAYVKGSKADPYTKCELEGICPPPA